LRLSVTDGGVVSVSAPDGTPRAVMHSGEGEGEIGIINAEGHMIARLSTTPDGGTIGILGADGNRACAMIPNAAGNAIMLCNPGGESMFTAMATPQNAIVSCGPMGNDKEPAIMLMTLDDGTGAIRFNAADGAVVIDLHSDKSGDVIHVQAAQGGASCELSTTGGEAGLRASHGPHKGKVSITADEQSAFVRAFGADGHSRASLQAGAEIGAAVIVSEGDRLISGIVPHDESQSPAITIGNKDKTPALKLVVREEGGAVFSAGDDGTRHLGMVASNAGGKLAVFSELGIERAALTSTDDGGALTLKWGGTTGLIAVAAERGGCVVANDAEGKAVSWLPADFGEDEEDE
jgi:hypothetical protein